MKSLSVERQDAPVRAGGTGQGPTANGPLGRTLSKRRSELPWKDYVVKRPSPRSADAKASPPVSTTNSPRHFWKQVKTALSTGMRTGELLNCTWRNVDFEGLTIEVCPKENTAETWEWHVKDADRRTLPVTEDLVGLLVHHQNEQPKGYPYVFVPVARYDHIQKLRELSRWKFGDSRLKVVKNLTRRFNQILAGHACFNTTHHFYLAVATDLVNRAREASSQALYQDLLRTPHFGPKRKKADNRK